MPENEGLKSPTIMVFDSGVGGLSVSQSILSHCSDVRIIYVADNGAFPYGTKEETYLRRRIVDVLLSQVETHKPDMLVIACNTASTLVLPDLRAKLSIPIVGVVPAIKPAAEQSKTSVIGLLATPATVKRAYTDQLVDEFAPGCEVVRVGSNRLVEMAEALVVGEEVDTEELAEIISTFFDGGRDSRVDTVVLGCTHFPLLRPLLEGVSLRPVNWIDSGEAIARQVKRLSAEVTINSHDGYVNDKTTTTQLPHQIMFTEAFSANDAFKASLWALGFHRYDITDSIYSG